VDQIGLPIQPRPTSLGLWIDGAEDALLAHPPANSAFVGTDGGCQPPNGGGLEGVLEAEGSGEVNILVRHGSVTFFPFVESILYQDYAAVNPLTRFF